MERLYTVSRCIVNRYTALRPIGPERSRFWIPAAAQQAPPRRRAAQNNRVAGRSRLLGIAHAYARRECEGDAPGALHRSEAFSQDRRRLLHRCAIEWAVLHDHLSKTTRPRHPHTSDLERLGE